ncbi:MAG: Crp/Fnr family transcriptional regulator [Brevundimonas sp.]|nr:Crp/Fnr family transcriptional regulator [Brevundimonas sp.]
MFRNHLLSSLGALTLADLLPHLREVTLVGGQVLCEAGEMPTDVYFPNTAVISIVTLLRDGRSYEVSSVGYEGVANLFPSLTGIASQTRTFVQVPGTCLRLPVATLRAYLEGRASLLRHLLVYLQINSAQSERTIACSAAHPLSGRLARWLLITNDRVSTPVMSLTQDYMCVMAGALRSSISLTASAFKRDGLITYSRGRVQILDRGGLERQACDCYRSDQEDLAEILELGAADWPVLPAAPSS